LARSLDTELAGLDGKDTTVLEKLYRDKAGDPDFPQSLITACNTQDLQRGATWLLKRHFDNKGAPLSQKQTSAHIGHLAGIEDWQAKLHVLQYLEHLVLPDDTEAPVSDFLNGAIRSEQKFVRAWAYSGLAVLARRFPDRIERTRQRLAEAYARETAASVKVRVRKALEKLDI